MKHLLFKTICAWWIPLLLFLLLGLPVSATFLTFVEVQKGVDGLDSPYSVAVSPDGKHVYVAGFGDNAVVVFSRNATTGKLSFVEKQKNGESGVDGLGFVNSVTVSPDGKHIYTAGFSSAAAVFSRDGTTGKLTFVEVEKDGVDDLSDPGGTVDGLASARSVIVSPDDKHVYVAAFADDAVAVFSRDMTTGKLAFVEVEKDGINDPSDSGGTVDGLDGAHSVTVSSDGKHLYATSASIGGPRDDAIAVFSRDPTTGKLAFVEAHKDTDPGVDGLDGATEATVSPDGKYVYVTGFNDDMVAVFSRNTTTGALSFVEVQQDGVGGVDGLDDPESVTISPNGQHLYVGGAADDAVAVFSRNATTGRLTFVEVQRDGVGSIDGLDFVISVRVSPDGKHVYAVGNSEHAVAVFSAPNQVYLPVILRAPTIEEQLINLINAERSSRGLGTLSVAPLLMQVAEAHSQDMVNRNFFSHTNPDGLGPGDRLDNAGYSWSTWGENIGGGYTTPQAMFNGWMNSPGHRANMLNPNFTEVGIGYVTGGSYGHYWTAVLARPAP